MNGEERLRRCLSITDSGDTEQEEEEEEEEVKSFNRNATQSKELPQQAVNYETAEIGKVLQRQNHRLCSVCHTHTHSKL
jgi:hypothetical protein